MNMIARFYNHEPYTKVPSLAAPTLLWIAVYVDIIYRYRGAVISRFYHFIYQYPENLFWVIEKYFSR